MIKTSDSSISPLPPRVVSHSSCFKCVVEDSSLTDQIKSWYELEPYGAFKKVDARTAADKHALSTLNSETVRNCAYALD